MSEPALALSAVTRVFRQGDQDLAVLRGADLSIAPGQMVALVGPSGAGKSTLLQIAGLLERPSSGEVRIEGRNCGALNDRQRTLIRRSRLGFVYQIHHLLPEFTALENVVLPQMIAGRRRGAGKARARELLEMVGLGDRLNHRPAKLSGGEQQRVAIARAVANAPHVLLADEPTGNLDQNTADTVFAMLVALVHDARLAALVATHNQDLAARMDRIVTLRDGRIVAAG